MTRRVERVNHLLRQEISELIRYQLKDPRLGELISITEVATSPDLKYASVFISAIGSEEKNKETLSVLVAASRFLRGELSKRLRLRYIPELDFQWDDSIERGAHIQEMIDRVTEAKDRS